MIGYDLLLGHVAPPPVTEQAKARKVVATEMAGSVADQKARHGDRFRVAARNRARILNYLRSHGPTGKTTLCNTLDLTDDQFKRASQTLREHQLVRCDGSKWVAIEGAR